MCLRSSQRFYYELESKGEGMHAGMFRDSRVNLTNAGLEGLKNSTANENHSDSQLLNKMAFRY